MRPHYLRIHFLFWSCSLLSCTPVSAHASLGRTLLATLAFCVWNDGQGVVKGDSFEKRMTFEATNAEVTFYPMDGGSYWLGNHFETEGKVGWRLSKYDENEPMDSYGVFGEEDIYLYDLFSGKNESIATLGGLPQANKTYPFFAMINPSHNQSIGHTFAHAYHPVEMKQLVHIGQDRYFVAGSLLNTSSGKDLFMAEIYDNGTVHHLFTCDIGWHEEVEEMIFSHGSIVITGHAARNESALTDLFFLALNMTYHKQAAYLFGTMGRD